MLINALVHFVNWSISSLALYANVVILILTGSPLHELGGEPMIEVRNNYKIPLTVIGLARLDPSHNVFLLYSLCL